MTEMIGNYELSTRRNTTSTACYQALRKRELCCSSRKGATTQMNQAIRRRSSVRHMTSHLSQPTREKKKRSLLAPAKQMSTSMVGRFCYWRRIRTVVHKQPSNKHAVSQNYHGTKAAGKFTVIRAARYVASKWRRGKKREAATRRRTRH